MEQRRIVLVGGYREKKWNTAPLIVTSDLSAETELSWLKLVEDCATISEYVGGTLRKICNA